MFLIPHIIQIVEKHVSGLERANRLDPVHLRSNSADGSLCDVVDGEREGRVVAAVVWEGG